MKRLFLLLAAALLSAASSELYAQHQWAVAFIEKGKDIPSVAVYHSVKETAENGMVYHRIFDDSYQIRGEAYNPVKLPYGYRWADKRMFVYDFRSNQETLAFDFNLSQDDRFTTFNGMEWEVESVGDTLVNISFCGKGECVARKLLTVKTPDGTQSDKWLEDFGSLSRHFLIDGMEDVEYSQALWMEYGMGEYLAREIPTGPIYAHDTGWMDTAFAAAVMPYTECTYKDGQVMIEDVRWWYEHRDYACFYRDGDTIRELYRWELEPHTDLGNSALTRDAFTFYGLPEPESGQYSIHSGEARRITGICGIHFASRPIEEGLHDLQGRRLLAQPSKGIYIMDGKKVFAK